MRRRRFLFVASLYLFVVGSIVYIGLSFSEENVKEKQKNITEDNQNIDLIDKASVVSGTSIEKDRKFSTDQVDDEKRENELSGDSGLFNNEFGKQVSENPHKEKLSTQEKIKNQIIKDEKGNELEMGNKGTVLSSLGTAYEIQDNTIVDRWGVIIKLDRLPEELRNAAGYTVLIGEKTYELTLNKYNSNVFNTQVSSIEHTKNQIEQAIISVK